MSNDARRAPLYWAFVLFVGVLAVAGYAGYVLYPRFDLPATVGIGLLALSVAAGVASFFSPCSFPLLVTLLSRQTGAEESSPRRSKPLTFAAALALGAAVFLLILGLAVALGGGAIFKDVTFASTAGRAIRIVVGGLLILLGLIQLNVIPFASLYAISKLGRSLSGLQARQRRRRPVLGFAIFGFGYPLAGFG